MMAIARAEVPIIDSAPLAGSRVPEIIVCNTILIVIISCGMLMRGFVVMRYHGISTDDALCAISWVFAFILCFISMWMTRYGYGRHMALAESDMSAMVTMLKLDFVTFIAYLISLTAVKSSFCLLYMRLFPATYITRASWILMAFVICQFIEEIAVVIFHCSPIHKFWDARDEVEGQCLDLMVFYYISFGIKLVTDIAIFALPVPLLLNLNLSSWKKASLIFMFGLGLLVCATSIIRSTYLPGFQNDFTWNLVDALNWSSVEVCVFIFISCLPSFKALITYNPLSLRKVFWHPSNHESQLFDSPEHESRAKYSHISGRPATYKRHIKVENAGAYPQMVEDIEDSVVYMAGGRMR